MFWRVSMSLPIPMPRTKDSVSNTRVSSQLAVRQKHRVLQSRINNALLTDSVLMPLEAAHDLGHQTQKEAQNRQGVDDAADLSKHGVRLNSRQQA